MDERADSADAEPEFTRPPTVADLVHICRLLNSVQARYVVIGGMAMNWHGLVRGTHDIDLLVDDDVDNMRRVIKALAQLPDGAAAELQPEELQQYTVLRINEEVTIDLLGRACDVRYADAAVGMTLDTTLGEPIPFPSREVLIRTKNTVRPKDHHDVQYLQSLRD